MAEYDIIKPSFPPPVTEPPTTSYPYLASIGVPFDDLRNSCVKEVEVISVDALANTVSVLLDSVEYPDIPVWIHTDYGCRRRMIQEEEAADPADYCERAACLFPFAGGVQIGAGPFDLTLTPKALALVHIEPLTLIVTVKGIISVVQSVEKKRDTIDNVCFPTWKPYLKIRFQSFRFTVGSGEEYEYSAGYGTFVKKSDGTTPYVPDVTYRTVVWDILKDAIALIPNAARGGYVEADTEHVGGNPASLEEIESFIAEAVKEYNPEPDSFLDAQPYCTTDITDPQTSPFGDYVDYEGTEHYDAWSGSTSGTTNWSEVSGSYSGAWAVPLKSVSIQLDKWAAHPNNVFYPLLNAFSYHWYYDTSAPGYILGQQSQNRLSNGGNYRATFVLDGKGYVIERYVKDLSFSGAETRHGPEIGYMNYAVEGNYGYSFYLGILEGGVDLVGYDIQCSSSLDHDASYLDGEDGGTLTHDTAYQVIATRQEPVIAFCDSLLTGEAGVITNSVSSAIAVMHNFDEDGVSVDIDPSVQDKMHTNCTRLLGKDIMGTGLFANYIGSSVYEDFHEPGKDSANNPAVLIELGGSPELFRYRCLYTPDSIHAKDIDYLMIQYNLKDSEIPV